MFLTLRDECSPADIEAVTHWLSAQQAGAKQVDWGGKTAFVTSNEWTFDTSREKLPEVVESHIRTETEFQLSSRAIRSENTEIALSTGLTLGTNQTIMMAGPCAVESEKQAMTAAEYLSARHEVPVFRAGAFKPRTSPYSFQGLGDEGLRILRKVRERFGMLIVSEVKDTTHLEAVAEVADIVQVGAKSMYNFSLLERCGRLDKPILLKRGFMSTIKEFLQAADVIMANGNPNVILCERGIRTFEPQTRFSLDVCGAALIKSLSHLPLVLDPSHAVGLAAQVPLVAYAAAALGVDGLIVEVHPDPPRAKSDRAQALSLPQFTEMAQTLDRICAAVGRRFVY